MANFAQLNTERVVINIIVCDPALVATGYLGDVRDWVEYPADGEIGKNTPALGYTYDIDLDAFIPPQPYSLWTLDEKTCTWVAPVPAPDDGKNYGWSEKRGRWCEILPISVCEYPDKNNADFAKDIEETVLTLDTA